MSKEKSLVTTSANKLEKELSTELLTEICSMRSSGQSISQISDYVCLETEKRYSDSLFLTFFKQNAIVRGDEELRKQLSVTERYRKLEKYRRSDYVANIIEKTISRLDKDFCDLKDKDRVEAIVNLSKIMLETISKESYFTNGAPDQRGSANVQINLNDTMNKIAKEKQDVKKEILSSAKYETEEKIRDVEVEIVSEENNNDE